MLGLIGHKVVGRMPRALGVYLLVSAIVHAEHLPIKKYTTADGLAQNSVNRIMRDSRGFLWFCTDEGLSRFDGYTFTNYTTADGLPHPVVRDVLETRGGVYWVGTGLGVCRFNPKGHSQSTLRGSSNEVLSGDQGAANDGPRTARDPMFISYSPDDDSRATVNILLEDRTGAVWCGAGRGLYRLQETNGDWTLRVVEIGLPREVENDMRVRALAEDGQGTLWIGAGSGLYRRLPDGRTERYTTEQGLPGNEVLTLLVDADGQIWVGTREGLSRIALEPKTHQPRVIRVYTAKNGLRNPNTRSLFQSSTGQLWVGLSTALAQFDPKDSRDSPRFRRYVNELGVSKLFVQTLTEDRDGNLWIGTDNGALKLARNGFVTYTEADGLGESFVSSLFESRAGDLCGMTFFSSSTPLSWFDGDRFRAIRPQLPQRVDYLGWGWHQLTLQDRAGEWWLPTGQGLVRYPKVDHVGQLATTPPKAIYTTRDGLVSNDVFRLYEDSRGDIWISTFSEARGGITRWERATETFHNYGEADGLPTKTPVPHSFTEDHAGNLWIGLGDTNCLARFTNGRFTLFTSEQGLPAGSIYNLYLDHHGRLWIASTTSGLVRLDDPIADRPRFITYTTAQGFSSNSINCITEDRYGRLYVGTARGLDRFDPESGRVKPFTAADGLISGQVLVSFRDRKGDLWFGGKAGLSRLSPQPDPPQLPPPVFITGLRIGGETHQISALGESEIDSVELGPNKNQIQIDFVAMGFSTGEGLRYQYKLEGAGADWSQLADQRTVNFANLAPGRYHFLVRAVNADGVMSEPPASFSFTILPAVWRRWWFVTIVAALVGLIAYALYSYRVRRLLELERVRTRIAADLHDDIGSNLTKIGILSEVVNSRLTDARNSRTSNAERPTDQNHGVAGILDPLSSIARISRESVASMSDIVWAINPKRDTLRDLTSRMREFAGEVFANRNIEFELRAPSSETYIKVGADVRRTLFLIFKEAVNNIVRHSDCNEVDIELIVKGSKLVLSISDDGRGFDHARQPAGNGLASMRGRAASMGGEIEIISREPSGTAITLFLPIRQGKTGLARF